MTSFKRKALAIVYTFMDQQRSKTSGSIAIPGTIMRYFGLFAFVCTTIFPQAPEKEPLSASSLLFNKQFLRNYEQVREFLIIYENCQPVSFYSDDGIPLRGLLRPQDNAQVSLIFCTGFFPGHKEGLATFLELLPVGCNVLFFDARGHGESDGPFFSVLHKYGCDEFKDIIGAIRFLNNYQPHTPIIVHGLCAGAFHATRALHWLHHNNLLEQLHVQGLIFDSGVTSMVESVSIPRTHACNKVLPACFRNFFYPHATPEEVNSYFSFWALSLVVTACLKSIELCLTPFLYYHTSSTNLLPIIADLPCPIWYIHAQDDLLAPYKNIVALAACSKNSWCWWPDHGEHAQNHLQYAQEYKERFQKFINYCHAHAPGSTAS